MAPNEFFKEKYDVVIIGGSLTTLTSAIKLAEAGKSVLVLEQHNLPGGCATSYVRGEVEFEASLHEMNGIGTERCPLYIRQEFNRMNIDIDFVRVPEAFDFVTPTEHVVIHGGIDGDYSIPSREIADFCGEKEENGPIFNELMRFFHDCLKIYNSSNYLAMNKKNLFKTVKEDVELVRGAGYSSEEVFKAYKLPKPAIDILSAYWLYLGSPIKDLPFNIYAFILADYLGYGAYIPRHTSYEMSMKLNEKAEELGVQTEYGQRVEKILVRNKKAYGVVTKNGETILADYVICGAYPDAVYSKMIEPKIEVPYKAFKAVNSKEIGVTCFTVVLLLDKPYEELNIKSYSTFYSPEGFDFKKIWDESAYNDGPFKFIVAVCHNVAIPDVSPKGTCIYSMTYCPMPQSFFGVTEENYEDLKYKNAMYFIEEESKRLGVNLKDHIKEIIFETPVSIAHYTGAYQGCIYGYRHTMENHVVARSYLVETEDNYIRHLFFAGAHQINGDGMAPCITHGVQAANKVLKSMKLDLEAAAKKIKKKLTKK